MNEEQWFKTDNVAKIFLATYNRRATRCMRLACTLNEPVDKDILQQALLATIRLRPQFQVRIRRGFFWHYIESTNELPKVTEESGSPCPLLYGQDYKGVLHYKVTYFDRRINLDIFHALSDGTGAMEFFNALVTVYIRMAHPDDAALQAVKAGSGAGEDELNQNAFSQFYDHEKIPHDDTPVHNVAKKAYHFYGRKLPMDQLRYFEIKMPAGQILPKAKEIGVTLGSYLGARIMMALYKSMPSIKRKMPITVSMPVNLRNFFPTETSRNFFNSVTISHTFDGSETIESLAKEFDSQMKANLQPDRIRQKMEDYEKLERLIFVRMVPLFIKQPILRYFSKAQNKRVSFVLSNLGILRPAEELKPYIDGFTALCSHEEIFFTAYSYNGEMRLGVTYAYADTTFLKDLVRSFTAEGMDITVNATEVVK